MQIGRRIQEYSEYDLQQYYRGTYVLTHDGILDLKLVRDAEDDELVFDDCRIPAGECSVILLDSGYYNGEYIACSTYKDYKKGLRLTSSQALAIRRYLLTGAGYSAFAVADSIVYYKGHEVGIQKSGYTVIADERLAEMYSKEYRTEVHQEVQEIQEAQSQEDA